MGAKRSKKVWILVAVLLIVCVAAGVVLALTLFGSDPLLTVVNVEAGDPVPEAEAFRANPQKKLEVSYADPAAVAAIDTTVPGSYPVDLLYKKRKIVPAALLVRDTTAPAAVTRDVEIQQLEPPVAEDFLESVTDVSPVTAAFAAYPNMTDPNPQTVTIVLTDAYGNRSEVTALLTVRIDSEPPVIDGTKDITVYEGDTVSYRAGVTVTDNEDENPMLEIDSQDVDLSTPGEYTVTYSAVDASGNAAEKTITVTVLERQDGYVSMEEIDAVVEQVLNQILTPDMDTRQQLRAIFDYIRSHAGYVNHSVKDDWRQAGYRLLVRHSGDCFNYFAAGKLLMEKLGIPNIDVVKVKNYASDSNHYWSLVSVDGGETYYHFDMTPRTVPSEFFLVTDAELDAFSAAHNKCFNRDKSLYPATPEN